jgi:hypothetical protein
MYFLVAPPPPHMGVRRGAWWCAVSLIGADELNDNTSGLLSVFHAGETHSWRGMSGEQAPGVFWQPMQTKTLSETENGLRVNEG